MKNDLGRFYRLLYFSPRPEDEERVCVAVLIQDGTKTHLEYDRKLEKVHFFAPDYTRDSLAFILESIADGAREAAASGKLPGYSPQFSLSAPRTLLHELDQQVIDVLRHRYLLKMKSAEQKQRERGLHRKIDLFLAGTLGVPQRATQSRVRVEDLFGAEFRDGLPSDLVPKPVARALVTEKQICLVDAVDLHVESTDLLVGRVNRVARTFWQYGKLEEITGASLAKKIVRAALIFDGNEPNAEPPLKWRLDYVVHQLGKDSDVTVKSGAEEQETRLRKILQSP